MKKEKQNSCFVTKQLWFLFPGEKKNHKKKPPKNPTKNQQQKPFQTAEVSWAHCHVQQERDKITEPCQFRCIRCQRGPRQEICTPQSCWHGEQTLEISRANFWKFCKAQLIVCEVGVQNLIPKKGVCEWQANLKLKGARFTPPFILSTGSWTSPVARGKGKIKKADEYW